ncbi:MAG: ABC transporter substrate-binding protein [Eubacteriales bacterium]|nr:ABC transporter substrate-binding protein [Eubacteriales bacterium]
MKQKKIIATLLAASMTMGLFVAEGMTALADDYDQVVYAYATFNNIPSEEDLDVVEEAINEITREKIGAEITLKPIGIADYSSSVSLSLQAGEKIDLFESLGNFNNCVSTGMAYDITELLDTCAAESKELMGEAWLEACSKDGSVYGLPTYKPVALTPMVIYRQDIADELELDMSAVNSYEDLTDILRAVKEAKPDMTPLAPTQAGTIGMINTLGDIDWLTDDYTEPKGVLIGDDMTVSDLYSTDLFKEKCELVRSWYTEGLVMQDAATTTSMAAELMSSGNYFCYVASYSYPEEDTAASLQAQCGSYELGAKMIGDAYLSTADINALTWIVASNTKVPEAALKFLNLTFTDEDVCNLLIYGIEGRDYVKAEDGSVSYPEGEDAATVPYTAQLSCGTLGNFFIMYPTAGTNPDSLEWELEQNQNAKTSAAMGFTFDSSKLKTQYTAVSNVIQQYLPGLQCGSIDPETEIPKFVEALNNAGFQDIISAKQEQLDAWLAAQ